MNKKKKILIIFTLTILILMFIAYKTVEKKNHFISNKTTKENINKKNIENIEINLKEGSVLNYNQKIKGYIVDKNSKQKKENRILHLDLVDKDNNLIGRQDINIVITNEKKVYFENNFKYNQTIQKIGYLEIKLVDQNNQNKIFFYKKIKVKLNNQPEMLNNNFLPENGSPFVSIPTYAPLNK